MGEIFLLAFFTFAAFAIVMWKIGIGKFLRLGWVTDLGISFAFGIIFFGTFAGMAVGLIAGIFLSVFLSICRFFRGSPTRND